MFQSITDLLIPHTSPASVHCTDWLHMWCCKFNTPLSSALAGH